MLFAGVVSSVLAGAPSALLLAFILPVTLHAPASQIPDRLGGWAPASVAAQCGLQRFEQLDRGSPEIPWTTVGDDSYSSGVGLFERFAGRRESTVLLTLRARLTRDDWRIGMRFTSSGVAVAAMIGITAVGVGVFGTGIAEGSPTQSKKPSTFQMYANVDQLGDLGSNVGAKSVTLHKSDPLFYEVTFNRPIGSCAAQVQPGFAGGDLVSGPFTSEVVDGGAKTFDVEFLNTVTNQFTTAAFMMTVTCGS